MKRQLISLAAIAAILMTVALPLYAEDDFDATVHRISNRIGKRPMHIPFLGALLFFTPARSGHVKLATFEDVHVSLTLGDLQSSLGGVLSAEWHPFVKVDSRRDHECTLIYARTNGEAMRLMVITAETNEVTVVQVDVPKKLQGSWLDDTKDHVHKNRHDEANVEDGDGA
jgi:hypothetical protein